MITKRALAKTLVCFCAVVVLSTVFDKTLYSDTQRYTDSQLIQIGQDAYYKRDFPGALMFLFAYIQKYPQALANNPTFYAEVQRAYETSLDEVRRAFQQQAQQSAQRRPSSDGDGNSTSSNLSRPLPRLNIPPEAR